MQRLNTYVPTHYYSDLPSYNLVSYYGIINSQANTCKYDLEEQTNPFDVNAVNNGFT